MLGNFNGSNHGSEGRQEDKLVGTLMGETFRQWMVFFLKYTNDTGNNDNIKKIQQQ